MSFEEWVSLGRRLAASNRVLNWYIGDWWAAGNHRYGARAEAAAKGIFGLTFKSLAQYASVCRAFESSRRLEHLTFSHHAEVAALAPAEADTLLDQVEAKGWSTRDLRREVAAIRPPQRQRDIIDVRPPEPPCAEFMTVDEIIVELCDSLGRLRDLTERESMWLERSLRKIERQPRDEWTAEQDLELINLNGEGVKAPELAARLQRTETAIWSRIRILRRRGAVWVVRDCAGGDGYLGRRGRHGSLLRVGCVSVSDCCARNTSFIPPL